MRRLNNTSVFYLVYLFLFFAGLIFLLSHKHGDFVLLLNEWQTPFLNAFFQYYTYTGDGFFITLLVLIIIYIDRRFGFMFGLAAITQGLILLLMKQVFFDEVPRPFKYFEGQNVLDSIEGVVVRDFHSFPSGHTMTAFVAVTFLFLRLKDQRYAIPLLIGATLTGISRVYLGHHFLIDIMAGSLIGVFISTLFYVIFGKYLSNDHSGC